MLVILLAWMYISFLCYGWGLLTIKIVAATYSNTQTPRYGFIIPCFIGLTAIATIAQTLSFFTGLDKILIHGLLFLPAVAAFFVFDKPHYHAGQLLINIKKIHPVIALLLITTLVMVLVMGAYQVTHPDTIAYHAQSIKWAERYPVIPGLVHISYLYGLQNNWFVLCSLFSFGFTGTNALTFINTTVLAWLIIFITKRVNDNLQKRGFVYAAFFWLLLLSINLWTYTQVRLTATSGSPDFIAAIYILLTAYLCMLRSSMTKETTLLVIYLCIFTITVKLSALPFILLAFFLLYPFCWRKTVFFLVILLVLLIPFLTRNIIVSGYMLFPAPYFDFVHTDWKYSSSKLRYINDYILVFSRTHGPIKNAGTVNMPLSEWLPIWWLNLSLPDKLLIVFQFFSLIFLAFNYKKIIAGNRLKKILLFISLVGIIFWSLKAPDPRFGAGFLLLLPSLIFSNGIFLRKPFGLFASGRPVILLCLLLALTMGCYTSYRFMHFFNKAEIVAPAGITLPYRSVYYPEINVYIPLFNPGKSNVIIVPDTGNANYFNFRGKTVTKGFTEKK